ncbi:MAG: hypothetical protein JRF53_04255 [Deltaproteobacteria bacterium]|nr:hypothetical protein [Deltaproteobacteria bacterium]
MERLATGNMGGHKKLYDVPQKEAAEKLSAIISFKGAVMPEKTLILSCLEILRAGKIDFVDVCQGKSK